MQPDSRLCRCGCGLVAPLAPHNNKNKGWIKGQPLACVKGHSRRKPLRYVAEDHGYETPCWIWQLALLPNGYGQVFDGTRLVVAHRLYYEMAICPIPAGLDLDHLCRVRSCVNPAHLEPVSRGENLRRGYAARRVEMEATR